MTDETDGSPSEGGGVELGGRRGYGRAVVAVLAAATLVLAAAAVPAVVGSGAPPALSLAPFGGQAASDAADAAGDAPAGAEGLAGDLAGSSGFGALSAAESASVGGATAPGSDRPLANQSAEVHFVVETSAPTYWRTGAYGVYTGQGFDRAGDARAFDGTVPPGPLRGDRVAYEVTLRRSATALPTAWRPAQVEAPPGTRLEPGASLSRREPLAAGRSYEGVSYSPARDPAVLRAAGRDYPAAVTDRYLGVGDAPETARVAAFTDDLTRGADTPYATAVEIERWLEAERNYSLSATHDPADGTVASQFLFEMTSGYCEYFAATMVVMLRTQDVPARYVVGYSTGQQTGPGEYTVRAMNAHAWVEVYFPDVGWVRFDPTPGSQRLSAERRAYAEQTGSSPSSYSPTESGSPGETFDPNGTTSETTATPPAGAPGAAGTPNGTAAGTATVDTTATSDETGETATGEGTDGTATGGETAGTATAQGGTPGEGTPPTAPTATPAGTATGERTPDGATPSGTGTAAGGTGTATDGQTPDGTTTPAGTAERTPDDEAGTPAGSATPTATETPTPEETQTPTPEETQTPTPTSTPNETQTPTPTPTPNETQTPTTPAGPPPVTVTLNRTAVPGATVAVTVTRGDDPVRSATVLFNGARVGTTNETGVVVGRVPYARELNVTVRPRGRETLAAGGPAPVVAADGNSTTFPLDTRVSVSVVGEVRGGRTVTVVATVRDVPVRGAAVRVADQRVARTGPRGRAQVRLPTTPGEYTLTVRRGPVAGNRTVRIHRLNATSAVGWPLAVPFAPVRVSASLDGRPVDGAAVSRGDARLAETGAGGAATLSLPVAVAPTYVVRADGQRATTTVTGVGATTAAVVALGVGLLVGAAVGSRRTGISPRTVAARLHRIGVLAGRALLSAVVRVAAAADAASDALSALLSDLLARRVTLARLPGRLAGLAVAAGAALATGVRDLLAVLTRLGRAARGADAETAAAPTSDAADTETATPSARRAIRTAWRRFVGLLSVRSVRTMTPGEIARWATDRDGLPAAPVRALRDGYRAVEYGDADAREYVDRVRSALAQLGGDEADDDGGDAS